MEIVEIRALEGPNLFLLEPAIKVEIVANESERRHLIDRLSTFSGGGRSSDLQTAWSEAISALHGAV